MNAAPISLSATGRALPPPRSAASVAPEGLAPESEYSVPQEVAAQAPPAGREPSEESLQRAVEETNRRVQTLSNASVQFEIDRDTGDVRIRVVDKVTKEVIRWIPPEELIDFSSQSDLKGLLVNSQG